MDRRQHPLMPTSSPVDASRRRPSAVTIRLRPRGDPPAPPPPPPPAAAKTSSPSQASTTENRDSERTPINPRSSSQDGDGLPVDAGAVSEDGLTLPRPAKRAHEDGDGLPVDAEAVNEVELTLPLTPDAPGSVSDDELTLPRPAKRAHEDGDSLPVDARAVIEVELTPPDGDSLLSSTSSLAPGSISDDDLTLPRPAKRAHEDPPSPFSHLPDDLVLQVAGRLQESRWDLERLRSVSPHWRELIPSTMDPCLVFSWKDPGPESEILLFEIARTKQTEHAQLRKKMPLIRPPTGTHCWGSALGLLALQAHPIEAGKTFVYCLHCGNRKELLKLPDRMSPRGIYLEPYTPMRFLLLSTNSGGDCVLRVDADDYPWRTEGGPWWLPMPGFGDISLKSVALVPSVLRAAASKESIVIIDESGRVLDQEEEMIHLPTPPMILSDGTIAKPWFQNGHHLFEVESHLYFAQLFDHPGAQFGVSVRLFVLQKSEEGRYSLLPTSSIGDYSVYVGPNQAFILPACGLYVGHRSNTMYVEDFGGSSCQQRLIAVNFSNKNSFIIPFPEEVRDLCKELRPSLWVGAPQNKDLTNHCKSSSGWAWRFWD